MEICNRGIIVFFIFFFHNAVAAVYIFYYALTINMRTIFPYGELHTRPGANFPGVCLHLCRHAKVWIAVQLLEELHASGPAAIFKKPNLLVV